MDLKFVTKQSGSHGSAVTHFGKVILNVIVEMLSQLTLYLHHLLPSQCEKQMTLLKSL
jgi:hypothetical protein